MVSQFLIQKIQLKEEERTLVQGKEQQKAHVVQWRKARRRETEEKGEQWVKDH